MTTYHCLLQWYVARIYSTDRSLFTPFNFRSAFYNPSFSALNGTSCDAIINAKHSTSRLLTSESCSRRPSASITDMIMYCVQRRLSTRQQRDTMLCGSYITRHAITDVIWWAVNGRNRPVLLLLLLLIMWCSVNIKRQSLMSLWLCPQYTSSAKWTWTSNVAYSMSDYTVSTKFHVNRNKIKTPYPRRLARSAFFSRTSFKQ